MLLINEKIGFTEDYMNEFHFRIYIFKFLHNTITSNDLIKSLTMFFQNKETLILKYENRYIRTKYLKISKKYFNLNNLFNQIDTIIGGGSVKNAQKRIDLIFNKTD